MQCECTGCVISIQNNVEYLNKEELHKFYQKSYTVNLSVICNANKRILDKISFLIGTLSIIIV